jgi:hypothetical protein
MNRPYPGHTWIGLAIMLVSEALMLYRIEPVATFFTPVVWTGYILFMDGVVYKNRGSSFLKTRTGEFLFLLPCSVFLWIIIEWYNFYLKNWTYIHLPEPIHVRWFGYFWAFATILPGIFITAEWVASTGLFSGWKTAGRPIHPLVLRLSIMIGAAFVVFPVLLPEHIAPYLFGFVWAGFALLLDPVNHMSKQPSLFRFIEEGRWDELAALFAAGLICGFLWEFWNFWAVGKWVYTVPIMQDLKLFEMPLVGYLGFPAFAFECFVMTTFVRGVL